MIMLLPPIWNECHHDAGWRGYKTAGDRRRAIAQLRRRGFTYFSCYKDTRAEFALYASKHKG